MASKSSGGILLTALDSMSKASFALGRRVTSSLAKEFKMSSITGILAYIIVVSFDANRSKDR